MSLENRKYNENCSIFQICANTSAKMEKYFVSLSSYDCVFDFKYIMSK